MQNIKQNLHRPKGPQMWMGETEESSEVAQSMGDTGVFLASAAHLL